MSLSIPTLKDVKDVVEQFHTEINIEGPIEQVLSTQIMTLLVGANDNPFRRSLMADFLIFLSGTLADHSQEKHLILTKETIWAAYGSGAFWVLALEFDLHKRCSVDQNKIVNFQPVNAAAASGVLLIQPSEQQVNDLIMISQYFYEIFQELRDSDQSDQMEFIDLILPPMLVVAQGLQYSLAAKEFAHHFGLS